VLLSQRFSGSERSWVYTASRHFLREAEHFFASYKHLEGNTVVAQAWDDATAAMTERDACVERVARLARDHRSLRES